MLIARDTFGLMVSRGLTIAIIFSLAALAYQTSDAHRYFEQARQLFEQRQWDDAQSAAAKALAANRRRQGGPE